MAGGVKGFSRHFSPARCGFVFIFGWHLFWKERDKKGGFSDPSFSDCFHHPACVFRYSSKQPLC